MIYNNSYDKLDVLLTISQKKKRKNSTDSNYKFYFPINAW